MHQTFEVLIKSVPVSVKSSVLYSNIIKIEFYDKSKVLLTAGYYNVFIETNLVPLDRMKNILEDINAACIDIFKVLPEIVDSGELTYTPADLRRQEICRKRIAGEDDFELKTKQDQTKKKPKIEQLKLF